MLNLVSTLKYHDERSREHRQAKELHTPAEGIQRLKPCTRLEEFPFSIVKRRSSRLSPTGLVDSQTIYRISLIFHHSSPGAVSSCITFFNRVSLEKTGKVACCLQYIYDFTAAQMEVVCSNISEEVTRHELTYRLSLSRLFFHAQQAEETVVMLSIAIPNPVRYYFVLISGISQVISETSQ